MEPSDIITSIKATLYERISNPLIGTFVLSWLLWNYRLIWVLLSSMQTTDKFTYIDIILYPFKWDWTNKLLHIENFITPLYLFVGPLLTTLVYIYIIYPKFSKRVFEDHSNNTKLFQEIKIGIEDDTPVNHEKYRELKRKFRSLEELYSSQIDNRETKIKKINQENSNLERDTKDYRKRINDLEESAKNHQNLSIRNDKLEKNLDHANNLLDKNKLIIKDLRKELDGIKKPASHTDSSILSDEANQILAVISNKEHIKIDGITQIIGGNRLLISSCIDDLLEDKFIEQIPNSDYYKIAPKGKKYLLSNPKLLE